MYLAGCFVFHEVSLHGILWKHFFTLTTWDSLISQSLEIEMSKNSRYHKEVQNLVRSSWCFRLLLCLLVLRNVPFQCVWGQLLSTFRAWNLKERIKVINLLDASLRI